MENQGYFSQTFNNNCNTEPKYEMTEQMLHVRAVDCMNFALLDGSPSTLSLNTPIEFDVQFSNGNLNRTNTLSLTNIYDERDAIYYNMRMFHKYIYIYIYIATN